MRSETGPEAAAWLVLSVLSARRLRAAAMPDGIEPAVTGLVLRALTPPTAGESSTPGAGQERQRPGGLP